jgi:hypothetical protein
VSDPIRAALERLVFLDGCADQSPDWKQAWRDAMAAAQAALAGQPSAQPEPEGPPKNCWLDDEPELCPSPCVFDDPSEVVSNCVYAQQVKCKTECKYYRITEKAL